MEWDAVQIAQLSDLWSDPANSSAAIGRKMGISKNAVIGKVKRLGLQSRPSPILPRGSGVAPKPPRPLWQPKHTLPALTVEPVVEPPPPPPPVQEPCCWPIGEPGTRTFRYCDEPSRVGRCSYCEDHAKIAYQPKPARKRPGGEHADPEAAAA
jgi:GcrA cell cycle regulator